MLRLRVLKGPDKGKEQRISAPRVSIGGDARNDFILTDIMVSRFHALVEGNSAQGYRFSDLGSLNGSIIRVGDQDHTLHDRQTSREVELRGTCLVAIGRSVLEVQPLSESGEALALGPVQTAMAPVRAATQAPGPAPAVGAEEDSFRNSVVRRVAAGGADGGGELQFKGGARLPALFELARELNGLNDMDAIVGRVAEAAFKIFPLANFFAIMVPGAEEGDELVPLFTRMRASGPSPGELIVSQSILRAVVEKREAVLFVRDAASNADVDSRRSIVLAQITACLAAPLVGQRKLMGVLQIDSRGRQGMFGNEDLDIFSMLASWTAFAMERAELNRNVFHTFEAFVQASVAAIDARDPTTAGHSHRVALYTLMTAKAIDARRVGAFASVRFSDDALLELRYAALLHDFGKIGVREEVLQKAGKLQPVAYHALLERIERAAAEAELAAAETLMESCRRTSAALSDEAFAAYERTRKAAQLRFAGYREVVERLQGGRQAPSEADLQHLVEMRTLHVRDTLGQVRSVLSADDAEDLGIRRGTLNAKEREHIESHAALTVSYLGQVPWVDELKAVPLIAGQHHEKLNGGGYPVGIAGEDIVLAARILAVCDIYDALTGADRPYKRAFSPSEAAAILRKDAAGGALDPDVVEIFVTEVIPQLPVRPNGQGMADG